MTGTSSVDIRLACYHRTDGIVGPSHENVRALPELITLRDFFSVPSRETGVKGPTVITHPVNTHTHGM